LPSAPALGRPVQVAGPNGRKPAKPVLMQASDHICWYPAIGLGRVAGDDFGAVHWSGRAFGPHSPQGVLTSPAALPPPLASKHARWRTRYCAWYRLYAIRCRWSWGDNDNKFEAKMATELGGARGSQPPPPIARRQGGPRRCFIYRRVLLLTTSPVVSAGRWDCTRRDQVDLYRRAVFLGEPKASTTICSGSQRQSTRADATRQYGGGARGSQPPPGSQWPQPNPNTSRSQRQSTRRWDAPSTLRMPRA